jgi:hypothetical protein
MAIQFNTSSLGNDHLLYLYDFGGAHGRTEYKSTPEMIKDITKILTTTKLINKEGGYFIFGMTNGYQTNARNLLKKIGFKETAVGNLIQHSITSDEFEVKAALAIEEAKKEEARLLAEKEKAEAERIERDKKEGRKPGELRVGDVVWYRKHTEETRRVSQYVIVAPADSNGYVGYQAASSFAMYTLDYLLKKGNYHQGQLEKEWVRVDVETELRLTKSYPTILTLRERQL